jgi:hypothetical protein
MSMEAAFGSYVHGTSEEGRQAVTSTDADLVECFLCDKLTVIGSPEAIATELTANRAIKEKAMRDNLIYGTDVENSKNSGVDCKNNIKTI